MYLLPVDVEALGAELLLEVAVEPLVAVDPVLAVLVPVTVWAATSAMAMAPTTEPPAMARVTARALLMPRVRRAGVGGGFMTSPFRRGASSFGPVPPSRLGGGSEEAGIAAKLPKGPRRRWRRAPS